MAGTSRNRPARPLLAIGRDGEGSENAFTFWSRARAEHPVRAIDPTDRTAIRPGRGPRFPDESMMSTVLLIPMGVGEAFTARHYTSCLALGMDDHWLLIDCPHPVRKMLREGSIAAGLAQAAGHRRFHGRGGDAPARRSLVRPGGLRLLSFFGAGPAGQAADASRGLGPALGRPPGRRDGARPS